MKRRRFLQWVSHTLGAACAAVIALPGMRYLFASVHREDSQPATTQRVARLEDLPVNVPVEAVITGRRRDAWSMYPEEVIGKVWLVRQAIDGTDADRTAALAASAAPVRAYSAVCPHLRCCVQKDAARECFVCPCHRGRFGFDGKRLSASGEHNPANRGLDELECQVVVDETGEHWVEVTWLDFEPGISEKRTMTA